MDVERAVRIIAGIICTAVVAAWLLGIALLVLVHRVRWAQSFSVGVR